MKVLQFLTSRVRSIKYALKGFFLLLRTEEAILVHLFLTFFLCIFGFYFEISKMEWGIQLLALIVLFVTEAVNTAIEKICDFIHPDFHKKIGEIKDISAGAVTFAMLGVFLVFCIIYMPKIWV